MQIGSRLFQVAVIGITAFFASLILACSSVGSTPPQPRMRVELLARDLGEIAEGAEAAAEFDVNNAGAGILELKLTRPPAGLRNATPATLTIQPGRSARLLLEPDTWAVFGPAEVKAVYATNDPLMPQVTFTAKFIIRSYVVANPGYARYNFVQGEGAGTITQTLWTIDGKDFAVTGVESPWPWLRVEFREAAAAERLPREGSQWRVDTTITPSATVGPISGNVRVFLTHPEQKELHIAVGGFVRPIFAVTPPSADLGVVTIGQPLAKSLIDVQNFASETIDLLGASIDVPGLSVAIEPVTPGRRFRVRVRTEDGAARDGAFAGTIRVTTSSERQKVIEIPIRGSFVR